MRRRFRRAALAITLLAPFAAAATQPAGVPIGPDLAALGWQSLTFDGIPATAFVGDAAGVLEVTADNSASVLYRPLDDVDVAGARYLEWDWQVVDGLPATDLSQPSGEDRVLAVHVWFQPRDGGVGALARLGAMFGGPPPGRVLTYVWGGERPRGAMFPNPHNHEQGRMIVLRETTSPIGIWVSERVDLAADYRRAFGAPAPAPAVIAVSGDADDLMEICVGLLRGLSFRGA